MSRDLKSDIERWVRPAVRRLSAYHVPESGDVVKLDAMENPYGWPEDMAGEWLQRLRAAELNRYPDPTARALQARLREVMSMPEHLGLLLGNGSDELIQMLALTVGGAGRTVLAPEPTFVMYRLIAAMAGMEYHAVPLSTDFMLDSDAMLAALEHERPALVFLAYPNNPTGNLFQRAVVEAVVEQAPGLVVVDEAYAPFADASCIDLLPGHPNLLILRTLSKLGLAGLRLGYLIGARAWLEEIDKTRLPYNINVLTQVSAEYALTRREVLDEQARRIRADRERLHQALAGLPGVSAYPSRANFVLFRVPSGRARQVHEGLLHRGVLIKNLGDAPGPLADCLRVTVGTPQQNETFLDALREVLAEAG